MSVVVVADVACEGLLEAVTRAVHVLRSDGASISVRGGHNAVPNTALVTKDGEPRLILLIITCSDFQLLLRHNCAGEYFETMHHATGCPIYVVMHGQLTGSRQSRFWEGLAQMCANDSFTSFLIGVDFAPSLERAAEIIAAHGFKTSKQQMESDPLVRTESRRKCDPTDFHALYLDMLLEISSVSERRAAVIAGVFPSLFRLLEYIGSGARGRLRVEEYGEERSSSALDSYMVEVLSTDYNTAEAQAIMERLNENNDRLFT
ncbi:hypothetical protein DQ04_00591040 [Trypanosoma grayi]|uniref:hypothetical protein n=1 Tax=Trypanosoma grayi TaxID=71804 RepID=UPI0004F44439|nr:hypothetical protein DQ04_00591040 [Trypanosoma grayi]KEG14163.1 hypothetical protein DQ04_00591040 [Trypanosoma grayi]